MYSHDKKTSYKTYVVASLLISILSGCSGSSSTATSGNIGNLNQASNQSLCSHIGTPLNNYTNGHRLIQTNEFSADGSLLSSADYAYNFTARSIVRQIQSVGNTDALIDEAGRLSRVSSESTYILGTISIDETDFEYDNCGNITNVEFRRYATFDTRPETANYSAFDFIYQNNALTEIRNTLSQNSLTQSFGYDPSGTLVRIFAPIWEEAHFTTVNDLGQITAIDKYYSTADNIEAVEIADDGYSGFLGRIEFSYDEHGNLTHEEHFNSSAELRRTTEYLYELSDVPIVNLNLMWMHTSPAEFGNGGFRKEF